MTITYDALITPLWVDTVNHDGKSTKEEEKEDSNEVLAVSFYLRTEPVKLLEWKAPKNRLKPSRVEPPKLELKESPEHLEMLKRCEETNLVLNWEKCHFIVKEGIVLGHKVSGFRIKVDKAKIKAISKLLYPTNVKAIQSFLGHAEFDIEICDKKGAENIAADHLSRLKNLDIGKLNKAEIRDSFLKERLMVISDKNNEPCDLRHYFWDDPFQFKQFTDRIIRRCMAGDEAAQVLRQCHIGPSGGHHGIAATARKVFEAVFYWPYILRDTRIGYKCGYLLKRRKVLVVPEMPK
nr:hypothetical protein [Tanacetum cinerariifolium]